MRETAGPRRNQVVWEGLSVSGLVVRTVRRVAQGSCVFGCESRVRAGNTHKPYATLRTVREGGVWSLGLGRRSAPEAPDPFGS